MVGSKLLIITALPVIFTASILSGCSTLSHVKGDGEPGSTGRVSYNAEGISELVQKRRQSAKGKIAAFCNTGKYEVTGEKRSDKEPLDGDDLATAGANIVAVIEFKCL